MGIDKQENFRAGAIMIACGEQRAVQVLLWASFSVSARLSKNCSCRLYGAGDVNLITGTETSPNITQSETFTWANPDNPSRSASPTTTHAAAIRPDQHLWLIVLH